VLEDAVVVLCDTDDVYVRTGGKVIEEVEGEDGAILY
jgi:hypothetical protein